MQQRLSVFIGLSVLFFMSGLVAVSGTAAGTSVSASGTADTLAAPKAVRSTGSVKAAPVSGKTAAGGRKDRVQSFLNDLEKARNLDEASRAFKKYRFTPAELTALEKQMKKGRLKDKLDRFKRQGTVKPGPAGAGKTRGKKRPSLQAARLRLEKKQQSRIARLNRQAAALVSGAGLSSARQPAASSRSRQTAVPRVLARGIALPESSVDIRQLTPRNGTIGQDLVIQGTGFGSNPGRVTIVVGPRGSADRQAFDCPVKYWSNTRITLTIPLDCEAMVPLVTTDRYEWAGREFAWIHLRPAGEDPGGFENLDVLLDRSRFAPRIDSLNPDREISPGQMVIIRGRYLKLGRYRHAVRFEFGGRRFDVEPDRSESGQLEVRLPDDIEGLFEMPGTVEVKNLTTLTDTRDMTFVPAEEIVEIVSEAKGASCRPSRPQFLCLIGSAHRHTLHNWTLQNGWTVLDSWLETDTVGPNAGAYYIDKPAVGSVNARARIEVWADAYSAARTVEYFWVQGPRGTFRRSH